MSLRDFRFAAALTLIGISTCPALVGQKSAQEPAPNRATATPAGRSNKARLDLKLGPPKTSPQIKNPRASQAQAAIIAVLQKQRQAADVEAGQMKLAIRHANKAVPGGIGPAPEQKGLPAVMSQPTTKASENRATMPTATSVQKTSPGQIGPSKTSDAPGNSPASRAREAQPPSLVLSCVMDPTMRIVTVSGGPSPIIFTPDATYNLYTITGCSFGDPNSANEVYIYGPGGFKQDLVNSKRPALFWSDNGITASLDPQLAGVNDVDNVTLVIHRADINKEVQKQGFKFYAARERVPLMTIPQGYVSLGNAPTAQDHSVNFPVQYNTPAPDASSFSAEATRYSTDVQFLSTSDYFDFSRLAAGFTTDSMQAEYWPIAEADCSDWAIGTFEHGTDGPPWNFAWDGDNIRVTWQVSWCYANKIIGDNQRWRAQYALLVWVNGPRGLDPWTGKPN